MTATTLNSSVHRFGGGAVRRARPSGLDRAVLILGLAMVRAARRDADRVGPASEEYARVLEAQSRYEQHSDRKALPGRRLV